MPKVDIDYSNTIIYKITCKDPNITDLYVGHTTNFVQRKHAHKQGCINKKSINHTCKLYEVIRNNGGWDNWTMEIVNFFNCKDHYEARKKEQEYFDLLKATLNSIEPMPKKTVIPMEVVPVKEKETFYCEKCNIYCETSKLFEIHNNTKKHQKIPQNTTYNYYCDKCDYGTRKKSSYDQHLNSKKHNKSMVFNKNMQNNCSQYACSNCDKKYKDNSGLWRHKKTCNVVQNKSSENNPSITISNEVISNVIITLINQNSELRNIIEQKIVASLQDTISDNHSIMNILSGILKV